MLIRHLDFDDGEEVDLVVRRSIQTVLETVPELEGDPSRALAVWPNFTVDAMRAMYVADRDRVTHQFLVAEEDGEVIGHSIFFVRVPEHARPYGYLFTRYVYPSHRRRGIGRALLRQALRWLADQGASHVDAHTHHSNVALKGLLASHWFEVFDTKDEPWPTVALRRTL